MDRLIDSRFFWIVLLCTILGEFLIPWLLKSRYPGYNSRTMVMSVLGCRSSPVRVYYSVWLIWLGCLLSVTAAVFFHAAKSISFVLAVLTLISILVFAIGAGLLAGFFPVGETKVMATAASKIHGFGSAIGFMALLFLPLLSALTAFRQRNFVSGSIDFGAFILAFVFFALFIMGDKPRFQNTVIAYEGIWERLALLAMYIPFISTAVGKIFL